MTVSAAGQVWVTTLSEQGRVSINGMFVEKLSSKFKTVKENYLFIKSKVTVKNQQRWWNLSVEGSDRYAIRQDGRVSLNGERAEDLSFSELSKHNWVGLALAKGCLWSLRSDGRVSLDGSKVMDFSPGSYDFRGIKSDGTNVYHLRSDGAVFRDDEPGSLYRLKGGGDDGGSPEKKWRALAIDTLGGRLYALRADGKVVSAALDGSDPSSGVLEAELPFENDLTEAKAWVDIAERPGSGWLAIRGRGSVYSNQSTVDPIVTFPGSPEQQSNLRYMGVIATGVDSFAALQRNGHLYTYEGPDDGTGQTDVASLRKGRYRALTVSSAPPDLTNVPNRRPELMRIALTAIEGEPLEIPVRAVDVDLPVGESDISIDTADLPAGAYFDAAKSAIFWPAPGPKGKTSIPITVSDGLSKPVQAEFKVRVRARDEAPANRAPDIARMWRTTALSRQPFSLPIVAVDADGDALEITVVDATLPEGAVFDPATATLVWKPTDSQVGRHRVAFLVDDGKAVRKRTVRIQVKSSLRPW